jgi:hypothetical protein
MKPVILALIMAGILAAVIGIVILAVSGSHSSGSVPGSKTLGSTKSDFQDGSLVQPSPRRSASGYT